MKEEKWDTVITSKAPVFDLRLSEIWRYRDLLMLFVKRDIAQVYKQTILGPLWFFIQPIITTVVFTVVFGKMAEIPTDGIPPVLFYLSGITFWNFFAESLNKASTVFRDNQNIFGKVYFCRLVLPLSIVINNLVKLGIQLTMFLLFYFYFLVTNPLIQPNLYALLFPVLVLTTAGLALGFGLIITSLTAKYRDLLFLIQFGIQLWMFATPIIYPLSEVPAGRQIYAVLNPMTAVIETFKYGFLGEGTFSWLYLGYSTGFMLIIVIAGIISFNRIEKTFVDII
ncbi:MAG: ABC transporter permease [Saprospiraceae bacterium]|nr:MAG: ABC transporter permease [Saprospiraceae bacterium]